MPHDFQPLLDYAFTIGIELTGTRWIKPTSIGMTRAAYMGLLTASAATTEEKAALQVVLDARAAYLPLEDEYLHQVAAGQLKEAKETLLARARPAQLTYVEALNKFRAFQTEQIKTRAKSLDS